jgi:hypothetical protein
MPFNPAAFPGRQGQGYLRAGIPQSRDTSEQGYLREGIPQRMASRMPLRMPLRMPFRVPFSEVACDFCLASDLHYRGFQGAHGGHQIPTER